MYRQNKKSFTSVNREGITVSYKIEYTEKDEPIKDDYSNLKQFNPKDIEELIKYMFQARELDKHNINIGYTIEDPKGWLVEDFVNDTECFAGNTIERKQKERIDNIEETIQEQQKELDLYKSFIKKYNATKQFEDYKKEQNTFTYYFRLRPPSLGTHPRNGLIELNGDKINYNSREYWGYASYDRELTDSELYDYDLDK